MTDRDAHRKDMLRKAAVCYVLKHGNPHNASSDDIMRVLETMGTVRPDRISALMRQYLVHGITTN